jgi:hypothetical protein
MKKLAFISISFITLLTTSCKKETETCTLSSTSILGSYKIASILYKADAQTPAVDEFTTYEACEKDDILTFNSNGTWTLSEGVTSCNPPNSDNGNWSLVGNIFTVDGSALNISNFSCTEFTLSQSNPTTGESTTTRLVKQ